MQQWTMYRNVEILYIVKQQRRSTLNIVKRTTSWTCSKKSCLLCEHSAYEITQCGAWKQIVIYHDKTKLYIDCSCFFLCLTVPEFCSLLYIVSFCVRIPSRSAVSYFYIWKLVFLSLFFSHDGTWTHWTGSI